LPPQSQSASLERQLLTLNVTLPRNHHEPLQLGEVHPLEERLVEVVTVLLKCLDQLAKQRLTLLVTQPQDIPKSVHDGINAAQPIEVSLPVSTPALRHQLSIAADLGAEKGGGKPIAAEILSEGRE